jgi:hypothetical protein
MGASLDKIYIELKKYDENTTLENSYIICFGKKYHIKPYLNGYLSNDLEGHKFLKYSLDEVVAIILKNNIELN